ncbi:hypothetical protein O3P69_018317 [Scylla paramamosain]|uniref:Uncharacterized protein n=1 Tax=Scylla paramamosain TaxID=85552 RepID=A0AAW0TJA9_SCYPA
MWIRPWLARKDRSVFSTLVRESSLEDNRTFYDFHRLHVNNFQELLRLVGPQIMKQNTRFRDAISPAQHLSVTLRYLATADDGRDMPMDPGEYNGEKSNCTKSSSVPSYTTSSRGGNSKLD